MEELRKAARESNQQQPDSYDVTLPDSIVLPDSLDTLWQDISSRGAKSDAEVRQRILSCLSLLWQCIQISEDLLVAQEFLNKWGWKNLSNRDEEVVNHLYEWANRAALLGPVFGDIFDREGISEGGHFHYLFLRTGMTDTLQ